MDHHNPTEMRAAIEAMDAKIAAMPPKLTREERLTETLRLMSESDAARQRERREFMEAQIADMQRRADRRQAESMSS